MVISILKRSFCSILFIIFSTFIFSDEFSEGPYGTNYLDIAGPFSVPDLNLSIQGDVNLDETINIQDVILVVGEILGNISLENILQPAIHYAENGAIINKSQFITLNHRKTLSPRGAWENGRVGRAREP